MGQTMVKTANVYDITMRYAVFGHGSRQMVILPGLSLKEVTDAAVAVAAAYDCFTDDFTVYLFDRRLNLPMNYTARQMASDTAEVMRALGIREACVFGASQGGIIAQFLAVDAPELVSALSLASTFCEENDLIREVLARWIQFAEEGDGAALIRDMVEHIYSADTRNLYGEAVIQSYGTLTRQELERFRLCAEACAGQETKALLSHISCPVQVFGAEGDRMIPAESTRALAEKLHASCVMYDENYGHAVYDEAPDFKEQLLTFFRSSVIQK